MRVSSQELAGEVKPYVPDRVQSASGGMSALSIEEFASHRLKAAAKPIAI
jgi:hypothetical protein